MTATLIYAVVNVGCLECGVDSRMVLLTTSRALAHTTADDMNEADADDSSHKIVVLGPSAVIEA